MRTEDEERNLTLRKLRNKLGYGFGWTFWGALRDKTQTLAVAVVIFIIVLWLTYHIEIVWKP
jgi:hypothetical protein